MGMLLVTVVLAVSLAAGLVAWGVRRRRVAGPRVGTPPAVPAAAPYVLGASRRTSPPVPPTPTPLTRPVVAAAALAEAGPRVCPSCRSEHTGFTYCPRDARRLISPEEMLALMQSDRSIGATLTTGVCPRCRRAQAPGQRTCPHDGAAFVPRNALVHWPLRPRAATEPTGVIGKVCPQCQARYDLGMRFCGHDGADLVVIN